MIGMYGNESFMKRLMETEINATTDGINFALIFSRKRVISWSRKKLLDAHQKSRKNSIEPRKNSIDPRKRRASTVALMVSADTIYK